MAGKRFPGTRAAVLAFINDPEKIMRGNRFDRSKISKVVRGYDMDGDGIPNWQDEETQGPDIQLVMDYQETSTQKRHIQKWTTSSGNSYKLTLQDRIYIEFVDKNTHETLDSFSQYLACDPFSWQCSYIESPTTVEKEIIWRN